MIRFIRDASLCRCYHSTGVLAKEYSAYSSNICKVGLLHKPLSYGRPCEVEIIEAIWSNDFQALYVYSYID